MSRVIALCLALGFVVVTGFGCMKCGQNVSQKIAEKAIEGAVNKASGGKANIDVGSNVDLSALPATLRYPNATAKARWAEPTARGVSFMARADRDSDSQTSTCLGSRSLAVK